MIPVLISGSGVTVGSYVPNWSDFFPPPPACPPSESESGLNTPLLQRHSQHSQKVSNYLPRNNDGWWIEAPPLLLHGVFDKWMLVQQIIVIAATSFILGLVKSHTRDCGESEQLIPLIFWLPLFWQSFIQTCIFSPQDLLLSSWNLYNLYFPKINVCSSFQNKPVPVS